MQVLPALVTVTDSLTKVSGSLTDVIKVVNGSDDVSAIESNLAGSFSGVAEGLEDLAKSAKDLTTAIQKITDISPLNLNLLNLKDVNTALDELSSAEYKIHDAISAAIDGSDASYGATRDLYGIIAGKVWLKRRLFFVTLFTI